MEDKNTQTEINNEEIINTVIARLRTIPANARLAIAEGEDRRGLSSEELIKEVRGGTDIGLRIIEVQLKYIRNLNKLPTPPARVYA